MAVYYVVINRNCGRARVVCPPSNPTAWRPDEGEVVYAVCGSLMDAKAAVAKAAVMAEQLKG